jgi:hypothetical protein
MKIQTMRTARQISAQAKALKKAKGEIHHEIPKVLKKDFTPKDAHVRIVPAKLTPVEGFYVDERKSYKIINANGYTKEQLSTELPEHDNEYIEQGIKIPLNYGMGVEVIHEDKQYIFQRNGNWGKAVVTVDITTWRGMSCGALHYYGKLQIKLPEMTQVETKSTLSSNFFIPMYENHTIELSQVLEQWEIDKYPENYQYNHAGDRHRGFYSPEGIKRRAREVFDQVFEKGWKLKFEEHY